MKKIILFLFLAIVFNTGFKTTGKGSKTLNFVDKAKYVADTIENPYYLLNYPFEVYKNSFIEKLDSRLGKGKITIADSETKVVDYTLTLTKISFTESIDPQTVNDTTSEDSGKIFPTQLCSMKVETALYNSKGELIDNITCITNDHEVLANNKKNHGTYLIKTLPDNIFIRLAKICATSTMDELLKKISKN